ncbi:MAG: S8 family serine peptidase [Bacteroidota bacterium]
MVSIPKRLHIACCGIFFFLSVQTVCSQDLYWITFTDKGDISRYKNEEILTPSALENRRKKGIALDALDYPVDAEYVQGLRMLGIPVKNRSRWFNSVSAYLYEQDIYSVLQLPFVQEVKPVSRGLRISDYDTPFSKQDVASSDSLPFVGSYRNQLNMLGLDTLQSLGFTGSGVKVAVFDNGFYGVAEAAVFAHLFREDRVLATRDFVDGDTNVFEPCIHCRHGTEVLSAMAGILPDQIQGSAPDATYILLRTENDASETPQEEDNWIAAAEYADSLGAQVFSTSLGYYQFDEPRFNYLPEDLDGNTALITQAGDIAASRGIIVVNSAGNTRAEEDFITNIAPPADGDSVIAVGAVDELKRRASFSKYGPTADGQIKPDVMAMGVQTFLVHANGQVIRNSGTSFSCPLISGMLACVIQAKPSVSYGELYQTLIESSDRFAQPDSQYGYGIPSAMKMIGKLAPSTVGTRSLLEKGRWSLFPNPGSHTFYLSTFHQSNFSQISLEIRDLQGRLMWDDTFSNVKILEKIPFQVNLSPGIYIYMIKNYREDVYIDTGKLIIER